MFKLLFFLVTASYSVGATYDCCECQFTQNDCVLTEDGGCAGKDCEFIRGVCKNYFQDQCEIKMKQYNRDGTCPDPSDASSVLLKATARSNPADKRKLTKCSKCFLSMQEHGSAGRGIGEGEHANLILELAQYWEEHPFCEELKVDNSGCAIFLHDEKVMEQLKKHILPLLNASSTSAKKLFAVSGSRAVNKKGEEYGAPIEFFVSSEGVKKNWGACNYGKGCATNLASEPEELLIDFPCVDAKGKERKMRCCREETKIGVQYFFREQCGEDTTMYTRKKSLGERAIQKTH